MELKVAAWKSQLSSNNWKPLSFGIFNLIEEDGFIKEMEALLKKDFFIDDFKYLKVNVDAETKKGIKTNDLDIMKNIKSFKKEIEDSDSKARVYSVKSSGSLIVVKLNNEEEK